MQCSFISSILDNAFTTTALAYDKNFDLFGHNVSAGIQFDYDNAGAGQLTVSKLMPSIAYHKNFGSTKISFGIQGGWTNKNVDYSLLSKPDQFDIGTGNFESTFTTAETLNNNSFSFFDLNTGFYISKRLNSKWEPEFGYATHHVNKPQETFFDEHNLIEMRHVFSTDVNYQYDSTTVITPSLMIMGQNKAQSWLVGARVERYLEQNEMGIRTVFGGINYRNGLDRNQLAH